MNKREIWAIINVEDVVENTDARKIMACYDFKEWERKEILSLYNDTNESLNEFRWKYVLETLSISNECFSDLGFLVKDLIDDIKMGYHKIPCELLDLDIDLCDEVNAYYKDIQILNFEYRPLRDYDTNEITSIEIYYIENDNISIDVKNREVEELLEYLSLTNLYKKNQVAC